MIICSTNGPKSVHINTYHSLQITLTHWAEDYVNTVFFVHESLVPEIVDYGAIKLGKIYSIFEQKYANI